MQKEKLIERTFEKLQQLSDSELKEANDFIDFLIHKVEDREITAAIQQEASQGNTFNFLADEEELYTTDDLKEQYN